MKSIAARTGSEEPRVPSPPGTRRTSSGGAVSKVCVGRMFWLTASGKVGGFVFTGSRVVESRERVIFSVRERTFMQSRGPKASRAWKPGKRTTPMERGLVGGSVLLDVLVLFACRGIMAYRSW